SQARTTGQAPSIGVHHAGFANHYIPLLTRICFWFAAYIPRVPLDHRDTQDWLRRALPNMPKFLYFTPIEYPSPSMNKTGTTEQALLTNHKPEPFIRHRLSAAHYIPLLKIVCL
uniref:Glycosyl transferase n=1 Tax=Mesocestoides corti TaxID=53468 RepID=A0A5K3EMX4_MESCO